MTWPPLEPWSVWWAAVAPHPQLVDSAPSPGRLTGWADQTYGQKILERLSKEILEMTHSGRFDSICCIGKINSKEQCFGSVFIWKKFTAENYKNSKTTIYLFLGLQKERPSYRQSLQPSKREHPALQNRKFLNFFYKFCGSFLPSWVQIRIRLPNPDQDTDPLTWLNPDPIRIGSETLVKIEVRRVHTSSRRQTGGGGGGVGGAPQVGVVKI